jgi:hypothetical protein
VDITASCRAPVPLQIDDDDDNNHNNDDDGDDDNNDNNNNNVKLDKNTGMNMYPNQQKQVEEVR